MSHARRGAFAAIAVSRQIPLVTRNKRDCEALGRTSGTHLRLLDWAHFAEVPREQRSVLKVWPGLTLASGGPTSNT